ncbi:MAG: hypothetical protein ABIJ52_17755 [Pseudomonadota bacterium]
MLGIIITPEFYMIIIYIDLISKRIFAARLHRRIAVWSGCYAAQETVIQFLGMVAGGAAVELGFLYQEHSDVFALDERRQPVQECFIFFISLAALQGAAKVPV